MFSPDCQFSSIEEANLAVQLENLLYKGKKLKLTKYIKDENGNVSDIPENAGKLSSYGGNISFLIPEIAHSLWFCPLSQVKRKGMA